MIIVFGVYRSLLMLFNFCIFVEQWCPSDVDVLWSLSEDAVHPV